MPLWDLYQEMTIRALKGDQASAEMQSEDRFANTQEAVYRNEDRIDRLLVLTDALWELASEKLGLTEAQLAAKVTEIDARDGTADGRRVRPARPCEQCAAKVPKNRATCLFCGHPQPGSTPFDTV